MKLEGFRYTTSLDLSMGYYHITLCPKSWKLCTIVLSWAKFEYQILPMGSCNSPDIIQEKMNELLNGLEYDRAYIDYQFINSYGNFEDHVNKIKIVLNKLKAAGFNINAEKSKCAKDNLEYLGFQITRQGTIRLPNKVQAIKDIAVPTNKCNLEAL